MSINNEFVKPIVYIVIYFMGVFLLLLLLRNIKFIKDELYRKIMHLFGAFSIFPFLYTSNYLITFTYISIFTVIVFLGLLITGKSKMFKKYVVERNLGEVKYSFLMSFSVLALLTLFYWGLLGDKYRFIIYVSYIVWGVGDAVASLVGQKFGRSLFKSNSTINPNKTKEGTFVNLCFSTVVSLILLLTLTSYCYTYVVFTSLVVGIVASLVELVTKKGFDTLSVPISVSITLLISTYFIF